MAVRVTWDEGPMDQEQQVQRPLEGALSPTRVLWYLRHLPYRDALPRPGRLVKPKFEKKRSGNPDELTWAIYGMLLDCIEQLSPRRRDIIVRCTIYGDPFAVAGQRWRCDPATASREEKRALKQIAAMTGWGEECK